MKTKAELNEWIDSLDDESSVAIDSEGSTLIEVDFNEVQTGACLDVGGLPEDTSAEDWRHEVLNYNTVLGLEEWKAHRDEDARANREMDRLDATRKVERDLKVRAECPIKIHDVVHVQRCSGLPGSEVPDKWKERRLIVKDIVASDCIPGGAKFSFIPEFPYAVSVFDLSVIERKGLSHE